MRLNSIVASTLLGLASFCITSAQTRKPAALLDTMKAELARSMEHLKTQQTAPYFLSYEIVESESQGASGSFGTLIGSNSGSRTRRLTIDLRVGDYKLDNTHPIRGS